MGAVVASAPAKVILFGEHFVVYGEPAIVLAIDKRAYAKVEHRLDKRLFIRSRNLNISAFFENGNIKVEEGSPKEARIKLEPLKCAVEKVLEKAGERVGLNVEVNSTVPVAAGLGSSAAVASAVAAAVGALLNVKMSKEDVFRIAFEAEKIMHGTPSGVDPAISTFGGTMLFQLDTGFKPLEVKAEVPLVIGNTGVERSTRVQVAKVRELRDKYPQIVEPMMHTAREIVLRAIEALKRGDLETLGELMNINHALLYGLGVSDESLEWLVNAARKAGALGAKLTGAGGGGCMIALANRDKLETVLEAVQRAGANAFIARKTDEKMGFIPVLYGDAIFDTELGFTILSGDQIASFLAVRFNAENILIGVDVDGLYDADPKTDANAKMFKHLTLEELRKIQGRLGGSNACDVTGGMTNKVAELISAVEHGIPVLIVNASKPGYVYKALKGEKVKGTLIEKE